MKVTFSHFGNYDIAFRTLIGKLGLEVVLPQKTGPEDIERGVKLSPEMYCFPFKVNIGSYLRSIESGADTIFMWDNQGICRQRYYGQLQEKILKESGYNVLVVNFSRLNIFPELRKISGLSFFQILKLAKFFLREILLIEKIEKSARFYRPREIKFGQTERVVNLCFERLSKVKKEKEISQLKKEIRQRFANIKIEKDRGFLKIGLIGEIYTLIDGAVNYELEARLGRMGVEVDRKLTLSEFLKHSLFFWLKRRAERKAVHYLGSQVGGHGLYSVAEMIDYAKKGFDGVIHLTPFGCLPETTVRPILQKISQEKKLPFLSISIDEQTGEAGIQTRLEAFIDLLWARRQIA